MRALVYCRVSTKEQTKNLSLPTQLKACRDYCRRHGYVVAREFIEKGESAKTANRTELKELLTYCRQNKGRIQALVVYNVTRFARERYDHVVLRAYLHKLGVTLRSVTEPIDDSSTGKLMEGVLAAFAQFDNDQKAERTLAGMLHWNLGGGPSRLPSVSGTLIPRQVQACFTTQRGPRCCDWPAPQSPTGEASPNPSGKPTRQG
jgi:DNA invertase Pin-like site-specific DNA recombinase